MRRTWWTVAGLFLLGTASPVSAQEAHFGRATCAELMTLSPADQNRIALWLHGYYAGAAQRPVLDPRQFEAALPALLRACAERPALTLLGLEVRGILTGNDPLPGRPAESTAARPEIGSEPTAPSPSATRDPQRKPIPQP